VIRRGSKGLKEGHSKGGDSAKDHQLQGLVVVCVCGGGGAEAKDKRTRRSAT
jgi:hypothetical protein